MRILIISDIHSNLEALKAILNDEKYDRILFLGDIVDYGPDSGACIEIVEKQFDFMITGNHDRALSLGIDCGCSQKFQTLSIASRKHNSRLLNTMQIEFLSKLPLNLKIKIFGCNFFMAHASPQGDIYKYIKPDISPESLEEETRGINADFILIGHSHLPMIKKIGAKTVINPGSAGQPRDGNPDASYCIWEDGEITIKRKKYNIDAVCTKLQKTDMDKKVINALIGVLKTGSYITLEAEILRDKKKYK
ncbi:MAG: YfcE family phosphodiesterase [Candidatus Firestonebacteria bacterium]|nr:YfcE family phosphodiesterase [Candidatus Firestonebacteria bacterium]